MRILRIRRGYTTNSSGANDYISPPLTSVRSKTPPPSKTPPKPSATASAAPSAWADAGVAASASASATAVAPQPRPTTPVDAGQALVPTATRPAQPVADPPPPQPIDRTTSNIGEMGCLGAIVVFLSLFGWRVVKKRNTTELDGD